MNNYTPINLLNTSLNTSEKHYFSYTINPLRKLFNSYYRSLEYYTVHLTNEILIVESYINNDVLTNFYRVYSYLPLPHNLLAVVNKSRIHLAKKSMELIKYKSISLHYNIIDSIDKIHLAGQDVIKIKLKLLDNNYELKAFQMLDFDIFKVYPVQKITFEYLQDLFANNNSDANFHFSLFVDAFSKEA